jgi:hypothetical protein
MLAVLSVTTDLLATFTIPAVAGVFDARLTCDAVLSGTYGDADPRALLTAAIESLQAARAAIGA